MPKFQDAKFSNLVSKDQIISHSVEAKRIIGNTYYALRQILVNHLSPVCGDVIYVNGRIISLADLNVAVVLRGLADPLYPPPQILVEPQTWKSLEQWTLTGFNGLQSNDAVFNTRTGIMTAVDPGTYLITLTIAWVGSNTAGNRELRLIDFDTNELLLSDQMVPTPNQNFSSTQKLIGGVFLHQGQRLQFQARQGSATVAEIEFGLGSRLSIIKT